MRKRPRSDCQGTFQAQENTWNPLPSLHRVAFLGNYQPRQCGLATFTTDVCESVAQAFPETECFALAMNDRPEGYAYPPRVRFEIPQQEGEAYDRAADFLNTNEVEVLCVQHEYGIYGGDCGEHVLDLLRQTRMPVVTTLHTILTDPNPTQRRVMDELSQLSDRLVTMTQKGVNLLKDVYGCPRRRSTSSRTASRTCRSWTRTITRTSSASRARWSCSLSGCSRRARGSSTSSVRCPPILEKHPNVVYIVLGATHPHVLKHEGEAYRDRLKAMAKDLGVADAVRFFNQFVSLEDLKEFIGAADIYITPYLNAAQITSGTLAYSFGAGKAVISTPYWHAEELLAEDRGTLVPFSDPAAIARRWTTCSPTRRTATRCARARTCSPAAWSGRKPPRSTWPASPAPAPTARPDRARASRWKQLEMKPDFLPPVKVDHLRAMSDSTGMFQHAIFNVPNFLEGYTTDDNARAYILTVLLDELGTHDPHTPDTGSLGSTYLAFLWNAFNGTTNRFRNFMSFERNWLEAVGSEDSHGRALWALGTALGRTENEGHRALAGRLFSRALPETTRFTSPRAWAFTILAIHEYLRRFSGDREANRVRETLAGKLLGLYERCHGENWEWFEDILTYDNAILPHALLLTGHWTHRPDVLEAGLRSLRWLLEVQTGANGGFSPIGSNGFYRRGEERAHFDQQPLEATSTVAACLEAYRITKDDVLADQSARGVRVVLGPQRPRVAVVRCIDGRLPRRAARQPRQPEPGRGIHVGGAARADRDAPGAVRRGGGCWER